VIDNGAQGSYHKTQLWPRLSRVARVVGQHGGLERLCDGVRRGRATGGAALRGRSPDNDGSTRAQCMRRGSAPAHVTHRYPPPAALQPTVSTHDWTDKRTDTPRYGRCCFRGCSTRTPLAANRPDDGDGAWLRAGGTTEGGRFSHARTGATGG